MLCNRGNKGLYSSGRENMNRRYLMKVDKGSKRIINLDPISNFGECWCIKFGVGGSDEQAKCLELRFFPLLL